MWGAAAAGLKVKQDIRPEKAEMMKYPRSPKALVGGIAHLGRFIDKIRLRNAKIRGREPFHELEFTGILKEHGIQISMDGTGSWRPPHAWVYGPQHLSLLS